MSEYNFQVYEEVPADEHISYRMKKQHKDAPTTVTEEQLENFHISEVDQLTENQLDEIRPGSSDLIIEKNLNDSKSKVANKFRNENAYNGDINKLEEKRISSKKNEDEEYDDASIYGKKLRWWEEKCSDELKLANSKKKLINAQIEQSESIDSIDDSSENIPEDTYQNENLFKYIDKIEIAEEEKIPGVIDELYIKLSYDNSFFNGDIDFVKSVAKEKLINKYPYLSKYITEEDFYEANEPGYIILDVFGPEYFPKKDNEPNEPNEPMKISNVQHIDIGGTPMVVGTVTFSQNLLFDKSRLKKQVVSYINLSIPDINITENSLDCSKIDSGQITFITSTSVKQANTEYNFNIITSDSKKN